MTRRLWGRGATASRRNATKTLALFLGLGNFPPAAVNQFETSMEIKIECACGQPFEFEVEPENGRMPCEVNCPACGASATAKANLSIRRNLVQQSPPSAPPAPAPSAEARFNRPYTPSAAAAPVRVDAPTARRAEKPKKPGDAAFRNGVIGAAVCAAVGMAGWFSLIHFGNIEIGWAAWGVGALTGLGARIFGGEGGSTLGALCALFTAIAIIGGHALGTDLTHFSPFIILFLFLGVGSAYKIGSGRN